MDDTLALPIALFDTLEHFDKQLITMPVLNDGDAKLDYQHAINFLYNYRGSLATFNSYRREIERLLQWCWFVHKKSLNTLTRKDFEVFLEFCQAPPKHWIGTQQVDRFLDKEGLRLANADWRPFVAAVSKKAFRDGKTPNVKAYKMSTNALASDLFYFKQFL